MLNLGRHEEALPLLESLSARVPDDDAMQRWLGTACWHLNHLAEARKHLERAVALDPDEAIARTLLEGLPRPSAEPAVVVDRDKSIRSPKPAIRVRLDFGRMGAHIIVASCSTCR